MILEGKLNYMVHRDFIANELMQFDKRPLMFDDDMDMEFIYQLDIPDRKLSCLQRYGNSMCRWVEVPFHDSDQLKTIQESYRILQDNYEEQQDCYKEQQKHYKEQQDCYKEQRKHYKEQREHYKKQRKFFKLHELFYETLEEFEIFED
jgi:hypothetical protein